MTLGKITNFHSTSRTEREMTMNLEAVLSSGAFADSGLLFKIKNRGRIILLPAPYKNGQPNTKAMKLHSMTMKERDSNELRDRRTKREKHASYRRMVESLKEIKENKNV